MISAASRRNSGCSNAGTGPPAKNRRKNPIAGGIDDGQDPTGFFTDFGRRNEKNPATGFGLNLNG